MIRTFRLTAFALLVAGLGVLVSTSLAGDDKKANDEGFVELFNGKDMTGWKFVPEKLEETVTVKDGAIHVEGKPNGYFHTEDSYRNYVLRFDWKFLKDGNSGLLVHIQEHKVWPKSLEVQGMQRQHGSIIPIGIKADHKVDKEAQKKAIKIGEWNTTEVHVKDGKVETKINDIPVSTAVIKSEDVKEGPFGLQSEGAPMLYKNIKIKKLD